MNQVGIICQWFPHRQLSERMKMDNKLIGLIKEPMELDKIIWRKENHQITKLYKLLLERNMEQEIIKENMIKWMQ